MTTSDPPSGPLDIELLGTMEVFSMEFLSKEHLFHWLEVVHCLAVLSY